MNRILCTLAVAILFATSALAKIIRVPADQPTIQAAINAAAKGDTVLVAEGTYYENINFKGKAITVASHFLMDADTSHISKTIINGSQPSHADSGSVVFFISGEDSTSVLNGFTLTQGNGTETTYIWENVEYRMRAGGGVFCYNSGASILNNKITNNLINTAAKGDAGGGGISALPFNSAKVIINGNRITRNTVEVKGGAWGAGILVTCNALIRDNIVSYNSCIADTEYASGGIDCTSLGSVVIESNEVSYNTAYSQSFDAIGGGLDIVFAQGRLKKNVIHHNQANTGSGIHVAQGGGAYIDSDHMSIAENAVTFNYVSTSNGYGGGFKFFNSQAKVSNNLIRYNEANGGAGVHISAPTTSSSASLQSSENDFELAARFFTPLKNASLKRRFLQAAALPPNAPTLIGNTITNNTATNYAGGLHMSWCSPKVLRCNISNNSASSMGGGVTISRDADALFINNTIANNSVGGQGGGLFINTDSDPVFRNAIIYGNRANQIGPQVYLVEIACDPSFYYCDVEGGRAAFAGPGAGSQYTGVFENNMDVSPLFSDLEHCYLGDNSQCIDAGDPAAIYNDLEDPNHLGFALWPARGGLRNDMGAYGGDPDTLGLITTVKERKSAGAPKDFLLEQNYPNPFNPTTTIAFALPKASFVTLKIYNLLGEEVATLVAEKLAVGKHQRVWEANGLASGVYLYRLEAGEFVRTRKLILLR